MDEPRTYYTEWSNSERERQISYQVGSVQSLSCIWLFATPWTSPWKSPGQNTEWVAIPSPGDLPSPGIKPGHPALQADSLPSEPPGSQSRPGSDLALTSDKLSPLQLQCLQDLMLLLGLRWGTPVSCWVWFPAPVNAQYTPAATIIRYAGQGKRTQKEVSTVDSAHLWWAALMIFAFLFSYPQWGTIAFIEI